MMDFEDLGDAIEVAVVRTRSLPVPRECIDQALICLIEAGEIEIDVPDIHLNFHDIYGAATTLEARDATKH